MRYPASEKLEIIRLVEQSRLPVRQTLEKLAILPARFYRWYDRYQDTRHTRHRSPAHRPVNRMDVAKRRWLFSCDRSLANTHVCLPVPPIYLIRGASITPTGPPALVMAPSSL